MNNTKNASLITEFFGNTPVVKIVSFLLENDIWDYSLKDICKGADVSWGTLHKIKNSLVKGTRKIGRAKLYRINEKNLIVKALATIQLALAFPKQEIKLPA